MLGRHASSLSTNHFPRAQYFSASVTEKLDTCESQDRLVRKCFIDYDREMVLVAERIDPQSGKHENQAMLRLAQRFHLKLSLDLDPAARLAVLELER
jgi:hypothetical protein